MNTEFFRLAIFASGEGTNAEAIVTYFSDNKKIRVVLALTNNPDAGVVQRMEKKRIPVKIFNKNQFTDSDVVMQWLRDAQATHLVLAGFLWLVPGRYLKSFPGKIINIHPALLPKFGGKGMYGDRVHSAVKSAGEIETGITVHLVNEHFDEGQVLYQAKCDVSPQDSIVDIASRVRELELKSYPIAIENWLQGKVR